MNTSHHHHHQQPRSKKACFECRRSKLRCDKELTQREKCTRCERRGTSCSWSESASTPPGSTVRRRLSASRENDFRRQSRTRQNGESNCYLQNPEKSISDANPLWTLREAALQSYTDTNSIVEHIQEEEIISEELEIVQARQGWTNERMIEAKAERTRYFGTTTADEPSNLASLDPMESGLVSHEYVERAFILFFRTLSKQTSILDPDLHNATTVYERSKLLFIVILSITASTDSDPRSVQLAGTLSRDMDEAVSRTILANAKSIEVVQALQLAYLFPQKTTNMAKDRSWLLIDSAIRIATELRLGPQLKSVGADMDPIKERQSRNAERTWLTTLVLERSLGTFTGMRPKRDLDCDWVQLNKWAESDIATPGDVQTVAYLNLRRLEHETRSQFDKMQSEEESLATFSSIQLTFNTIFDDWKKRWVLHRLLTTDDFTRNFLLMVGLHIQLHINVTVLRSSKDFLDEEARRSMHGHCISMAKEFCLHFMQSLSQYSKQLSRNPVSMIAWSALVLLQLDFRAGHELGWRTALALVGQADDYVHARSFSGFYGRLLLSIFHDVAASRRHNITHHNDNQEGIQQTFPMSADQSMIMNSTTLYPAATQYPTQNTSSDLVDFSDATQYNQFILDSIISSMLPGVSQELP